MKFINKPPHLTNRPAHLTNEHKIALRESNIKVRKVVLVHRMYDDVEDILDYATIFNSTYDLVEYFIASGISKHNNKHTILVNIKNVAKALAKGENRAIYGYRVYIEGINFVVAVNGDFIDI